MGRSQSLPRPGPGAGDPRADDRGCTILHVDMDAFFVAVEVRRDPTLRGRPVVVGGVGGRGVVASASYEARAYGVHSAMPSSRARRLCPQAVFVNPDHAAYVEVSRAVMRIFADVTPLVEPLSLDEAFLDVAGAQRLLGRPSVIGQAIRERVEQEQGITCSVGVAGTKFAAKLASTRCKPDGLMVVPVEGILAFLHPLPLEALWGVGEHTATRLAALGLKTVGDLAALPLATLRRTVGEAHARHLYELACGRDPRRVSPDRPDKSISAEETFERDLTDHALVGRELLRLSERVATRLRTTGQVGRTVAIKVRYADFSTLSRSRVLPTPTDVTMQVYETARRLFDGLRTEAAIRLVGVRAEGLTAADSTARQLELGSREHGWADTDRAIDAAVRRFGRGAVRPAALVEDHPDHRRPGHDRGGTRSLEPGAPSAPARPPGGARTDRV